MNKKELIELKREYCDNCGIGAGLEDNEKCYWHDKCDNVKKLKRQVKK
jgi:hypothetical protein